MSESSTLSDYLQTLGLDPKIIAEYLPSYVALRFSENRLSLYFKDRPASAICVDFVTGSLAFRSRIHLGGESLIKACAIKNRDRVSVLDATCGMGKESFLLHKAGFTVTATESNPVIYALLSNGLQRLKKVTGADCFHLIFGHAEQLMKKQSFDVIYLDPMFPEKKKSALVKKDMQLFQALHLDSKDNLEQLFTSAEQADCTKIVVKRPKLAPSVSGRKTTYQVSSKACRFDVYQIG